MRYNRDFTIEEKHMQRFYRMQVLARWGKGILGFGVVGALVGRLYMTWLSIPLEGFAAALALILAGVITMAFVTLGVLFRTRRNVRVSMARKGRKHYVQHTEIDGFGVHVTVENEKSKAGFEKLRLVRETKDAFYIFMTENDAWILPKEQMEERESECAAIRAIFTRVIEPRRLRLLK